MAGRIRRKPHTQIGQKGKGTGGRKPRRNPGYKTSGLPLEVGQFPKAPPEIPNFLPNTASFERGQSTVNDNLSAAGNSFGNALGLIGPQFDLQKARLDTDMGVATDRLKENLAGRGVYSAGRPGDTMTPAGAGIGASLYGRDVATPFGRAYQDLASGAAGDYVDAYSQYGGAQLGAGQDMFNLYNDRANDAFQMAPLSVPTGGYMLPHLPGPRLTTRIPKGGGGKTRPKKNRGKRK